VHSHDDQAAENEALDSAAIVTRQTRMPLSTMEFAMASQQFSRYRLGIKILLLALITLFLNLVFSFADGHAKTSLPGFEHFIRSVQDGRSQVLRGVYAPGIFALSVIQQPEREWGYVSSRSYQVTQFGMAADAGNIGLLAHNYLAGEWFSRLTPDQEIRLVYGDGFVEYFVVRDVIRYQALDSTNLYSDFLDLRTGFKVSASEVFARVYEGERHVTFQTCISLSGDSSWGRLFVIAEPRQAPPLINHKLD
jgi:hypothetical protein